MRKLLFLIFILTSYFAQAYTNKQDRLIAFAKLYSTVKFYYPEPKLTDFSWTAFAYKGYKICNESVSDEAFITEIKSMFNIIAPGVQINNGIFDIKKITPPLESSYTKPAFWQHEGSLNVGGKPDFKQSSLNYIYKKNIRYYSLVQGFSPIAKHILGEKVKLSFWAKLDSDMDSIKLVQLTPYSRRTKTFSNEYVSVNSKEWKFYEKEFEYPKEVDMDKLTIVLPTNGTAYIDDLKFQKKEGSIWIPIDLKNTNFETWSNTGTLEGWDDPLATGAISLKDEINKKDGKYGLKLNAIVDKIRYEPLAFNAPFQLEFMNGYKAYIPNQLKSNDSIIFPIASSKEITTLNVSNSALLDSLNDHRIQAIAASIETYGQLLHDMGYRPKNFEANLTTSFINGIASIETKNPVNAWNYLFMDFLAWVNDPHLMVHSPRPEFSTTKVRIPATTIISNRHVLVEKSFETNGKLKPGDVILKIGNVDLDSLFLSMEKHMLSVAIRDVYKQKLFNSFFEESVTLLIKRATQTIPLVFTKEENIKNVRKLMNEMEDEEEDEVGKIIADIKSKNTFYINASTQKTIDKKSKDVVLNKSKMDSLIKVMNQFERVIIDVRGRAQNNFVEYLTQYFSKVDFTKKYDVEKIDFRPIGQFKTQERNLVNQTNASLVLKSKVIFLIDYSTRSATERILIRLKNNDVATFVGSNTAGAAGAISQLKLNNNSRIVYTAYMTKDLDIPNDAMSYQGKGIKPDVLAYPTAEGLSAGKDEVLEKAMEIK